MVVLRSGTKYTWDSRVSAPHSMPNANRANPHHPFPHLRPAPRSNTPAVDGSSSGAQQAQRVPWIKREPVSPPPVERRHVSPARTGSRGPKREVSPIKNEGSSPDPPDIKRERYTPGPAFGTALLPRNYNQTRL